jgi:uroporphyrinogen-III synthase
MKNATGLQGLYIVVTRPAHQAQGLCSLIEAAGGHVLRLPLLEIDRPRDLTPALRLLARLSQFDIAIFISANAVEKTLELLDAAHTLPATLKIAAVGASTARALEQHGRTVDIAPQAPYNSESLLSAEALHHVLGKRIVIFRGEGGRETLAQTLRQRGAEVEYAEVYRRRMPDKSLDQMLPAPIREKIDIIVVSSNEGLRNLVDVATNAGQRDWLLHKPLVVISERTAAAARELGFRHTPIVAREATDPALVEAIKIWRASRARAKQ